MSLVNLEDLSTLNTLRQQRVTALIQVYVPTQQDDCTYRVAKGYECLDTDTGGSGNETGGGTGTGGGGGDGGIGGGWE